MIDSPERAKADLEIIDQQEQILRFSSFDANVAWQLGNELRSVLMSRGAGGSVEIELAGHLLFACATVGATPGQADWIRRKRNTVRRFGHSSYGVGRMLTRDGQTMEARHGLALADYAAHGGGFPLWIGSAAVGTVVLSGLPQREDHGLVVSALAATLGVTAPALA
jgi:uncharacterized protein (UPF0303 family)